MPWLISTFGTPLTTKQAVVGALTHAPQHAHLVWSILFTTQPSGWQGRLLDAPQGVYDVELDRGGEGTLLVLRAPKLQLVWEGKLLPTPGARRVSPELLDQLRKLGLSKLWLHVEPDGQEHYELEPGPNAVGWVNLHTGQVET